MANQPHPDKRQVHMWLHKDLLSKLDQLAHAAGTTRTGAIVRLIRMASIDTFKQLGDTKGQ